MRRLAFLLLSFAPPARAGCPMNDLWYSGSLAQSDAPTFDVPLGTAFGAPTDIGYDLAAGRLHEHSDAGLGGGSWVRVTDLYDVEGSTPGTLFVATAELAVSNAWVGTESGCGGTGCWGFVGARIVTAEGDSTEQSAGINVYNVGKVGLPPFSTTIGVTFTVGTPVPLTFRLEGHQSAGGAHLTDADASIRFTGLPPGVHVVSCQGYVDPSVPALPPSWGSLKAAYR